MSNRLAIYMQDMVDIREELELARYLEERGFNEIWQRDNRLARDCIVLLSGLSHPYETIASGVLITLDEEKIKAKSREIVPAFWERYEELVPSDHILG